MKYYRFKKNNLVYYQGYDLEQDCCIYKILSKGERIEGGGSYGPFPSFDECHFKSKKGLKNRMYEYLFEEKINKEYDEKEEHLKFFDEVLNTIKIEEAELIYPDKPCIIVKCEELDDPYECDAARTPMFYLDSMTKMEKMNFKYDYEVYSIKKNSKFKLEKKYSTYG